MVEPALYAAFGACLATLAMLLLLPALWRRAVRLTTRRLTGRLPLTVPEIIAAQDRLRAEHAIATRAVERRAEALTAEAARERASVGEIRVRELSLKAEIADLQDAIAALEADGSVVRGDLDRTGAAHAAAMTALEAAKAETAAAIGERDRSMKTAAAAETVAEGLRGELAAAGAALAAARADIAEKAKRIAVADASLAAMEADQLRVADLLRAETSRVADANAARLAAERRLVDETASVVALRAGMARTAPVFPIPGSQARDEAGRLDALRARLDEVADQIVRAAGSPDNERTPPLRAQASERTPVSRLEPSHAGA